MIRKQYALGKNLHIIEYHILNVLMRTRHLASLENWGVFKRNDYKNAFWI